jgi:general secretion pathway protein K
MMAVNYFAKCAVMQVQRRAPQTGGALILVILIVGLVTALATKFGEALLVQTRLSQIRQEQTLMHTYLAGAEAMAMNVLAQDSLLEASDHLREVWAAQLPPLPTDEGLLYVRLEDAQGYFNLNNLSVSTNYLTDLSAPAAIRFSAQQKLFIRLLQTLEFPVLTEADAIAVTEAIVDWIDQDQQVSGFGGAESLYYASQDPLLAAANQSLSHVSELALVRHMTPELLAALAPLVIVLPEPAPLNLNTAIAPLLRAINPRNDLQPAPVAAGLTAATNRAELLVEGFPLQSVPQYFERVLQSPVEDYELGEGDDPAFSVSTHYFIAYSTVEQGARSRSQRSLIRRDDTGMRVLHRDINSY